MTQPKVTRIAVSTIGVRYRIEGGDLAPEWATKLKPGRTAWCEITVYGKGKDRWIGSYGGEVWPAAWPAFFGTTATPEFPNGTAQCPAGPTVTDKGCAAFDMADSLWTAGKGLTPDELERELLAIGLPVKVRRDGARKEWVATIAYPKQCADLTHTTDNPCNYGGYQAEVTGVSSVSFLDAIEGAVQGYKRENGK